MKIEMRANRDKVEQDFGLEVELSGETTLENIFLSHLQVGHSVQLLPEACSDWGKLKFVFHNAPAAIGNPKSKINNPK